MRAVHPAPYPARLPARHATPRAAPRAVAVAARGPGAGDLRQLGSSDLMVSSCCLGTMTWGIQNTEAEGHEQMSAAVDAGVNFFDTAEIYPIPPNAETHGDTERIIGSWFKATGARDKIVLATKVAGYGNEYLRPADGKTRITKKQVLAAVDGSLARLGTDFIDLYQIHWPDRYVPLFGAGAFDEALVRESVSFEDQMEGMRAAVDAGKVRYWGVSNETTWGVSAFLRLAEAGLGPRIVSIQNSYSLLVRSAYETDLAEACAASNGNVSLLAYSPLAGGVLSGKYIDGSAAANSRLNLFQGYMERYNKSLARQAVAEYAAVAAKHGLTPTQLALGWCAGRWNVASSIIGATTMDQLKANLAAFDVVLSEEVLEDVERVYQRFRDPTTKPLE